jgi:hypothetical protein
MDARTLCRSGKDSCGTKVFDRRTIRRTAMTGLLVVLIVVGNGVPRAGHAQSAPATDGISLAARSGAGWHLPQNSLEGSFSLYQKKRACPNSVSYCEAAFVPIPGSIDREPVPTKPTIASGLGLGFVIGGVAGPIAGLVGEASPVAMVIVGGGVGLVAGGTVASVGQKHRMNFGRGFLLGVVPGAVVGAMVGATTFSHPAAPIVWGSLVSIPSALAGGIIGARFAEAPAQ